MTPSPYQKLPGRGLTWTGFSRVWLGADHVLLVRGHTWTESYRRFFFHDIQAVLVQHTHTGKIWNTVWGASAAFFAVIALMLNGTGSVIVASLGAPFASALLINLALGPTCACHIRTAVQTERLSALNRLGAARKFIARVEPLINAAQDASSPEQFAADLTRLQSGTLSAPVISPLDLSPVLDA